MHCQVVAREKIVVACRCKSGHADGIDYVCEEMLARGIFLELDFHCKLVELG